MLRKRSEHLVGNSRYMVACFRVLHGAALALHHSRRVEGTAMWL